MLERVFAVKNCLCEESVQTWTRQGEAHVQWPLELPVPQGAPDSLQSPFEPGSSNLGLEGGMKCLSVSSLPSCLVTVLREAVQEIIERMRRQEVGVCNGGVLASKCGEGNPSVLEA